MKKYIAKNMYSEVMIWRMGMNFVSRIMYRGRHRWMTCLTYEGVIYRKDQDPYE